MNMQYLMKQAQQIQKEIAKAQKELAEKEYESTVGGGAISIKAKGDMKIESITIDDSVLKDDKSVVEEMLVSGINAIMDDINKDREAVMTPITGGAKFPGVF